MPLDVLKKQIGARADLRGIMVMAVMAVTVAMPLRLAKKKKALTMEGKEAFAKSKAMRKHRNQNRKSQARSTPT